jgi:sodium/potassium-transporting ATPase subunit alpha
MTPASPSHDLPTARSAEMGLFSKPEVKADVDAGQYVTEDHILDLAGLATKYSTSINLSEAKQSVGLTTADAKTRLARDGPNALSPPKKDPEWLKFLRHLLNPFLLMMVAAGVLSVITYGVDTSQDINLWLGIILWVIVVFTAFMGYWKVCPMCFVVLLLRRCPLCHKTVRKLQERATSAITDAFKNMMPAEAIVIRDGAEATYPASELVVGDIVKLRPGSRVPADLRLIHVSGLKARWFPHAFVVSAPGTHLSMVFAD